MYYLTEERSTDLSLVLERSEARPPRSRLARRRKRRLGALRGGSSMSRRKRRLGALRGG